MLINLSNHPFQSWSSKQKKIAQAEFGIVVDLPFPEIPPDFSLQAVIELIQLSSEKCFLLLSQIRNNPEGRHGIHVMGEMTFVYQFVKFMTEQGIMCVASTTNRIVTSELNGTKTTQFEFVQFRPYSGELF